MAFRGLAAGGFLTCLSWAWPVEAAPPHHSPVFTAESLMLTTSQQVSAAVTKKAVTKSAKKKRSAKTTKPKGNWELPMQVVIVRSSEPGCEPNCPQWLMADGVIDVSTPAAFKKALRTLKGQKLPIIIRSPGGTFIDAITAGRMIRKAGLDVAAGTMLYVGCNPRDRDCTLPKQQNGIYRGIVMSWPSYCHSACPLLLAGGVSRYAGASAFLAFVQPSTRVVEQQINYREEYRIVKGKKKVIRRTEVSRKQVKSYERAGLHKSFRKPLASYIKEMGLSVAVMELYESVPPSETRFLDLEKRKELGFVTDQRSARDITTKSNCLGPMPAAYCVRDATISD